MSRSLTVVVLTAVVYSVLGCSSAPGPAAHTDRRFNPGHYVAIYGGDDPRDIRYLDDPAIRGVSIRYLWRWLERQPGEYDFTAIKDHLDYLASQDKQLVVFLIDRTWTRRSPLPQYMTEYQQTLPYGHVPVRWHPFYVERVLALTDALNDAFGTHPAFEGVAVQESAIEISEEGYGRFGFTPEKYRDALITMLNGMQARLPRCHVFWYGNFFPDNESYLADIATAVRASGVYLGGPDILPYRQYMSEVSYPLYDQFKGKLTLFSSAQSDSYRHHKNDKSVDAVEPVAPEGYVPMEQIFLFARDRLHVQYIFWDHHYETDGGGWSFDDAIAVIRKHPRYNEGVGPE